MSVRLSFLPGAVAAAVSSVVLTLLFALYVAPFGMIWCPLGTPYLDTADVHNGDIFFEKPITTRVAVAADGTLYLGSYRLKDETQLTAALCAVRAATPHVPLEIAADRRVATGKVLGAIDSAREAGYKELYVFGHLHALIESDAQTSRNRAAG